MATDKPLVNKVAQSGLITFKLEEHLPAVEFAQFDIKDYLFMELILKEADFRAALKEHDWSQYENKVLLIICSADAIIPMWANMLITSYATPFAKDLFYGSEEAYLEQYLYRIIDQLPIEQFEEARVVVKGCADKPIPPGAYLKITQKLRPVAKSIMFGEPCSTVPIFKKGSSLPRTLCHQRFKS